MAPVLAPAPPATAALTAPAINKRGRPKRKITSRRNIFRGEKKKIQGKPTPVKRAATKFARSKAKKAPKPNSLPGDKVVSEKEMRLATKALLLQNFLNTKMKEWGKISIEVAPTLNTERQTVMHGIEYAVNDRDGKAQYCGNTVVGIPPKREEQGAQEQ